MPPDRLSELYDAHAAALVLLARQWVGAGEAEDVVQDVFLRIAVGREPDNPRAWLYQCVKNAAVDRLRSRRRRSRRDRELAAGQRELFAADPAAPLDAASAAAALACLDAHNRTLVVLRIWGQLPWREVAELMDLPITTAHDRYRQALARMRAALQSAPARGDTNSILRGET